MKDRSRQRLQNIASRFGTRIVEAETARAGDTEAFLSAFEEATHTVLAPVFRDIAAELERQGHRTAIELGGQDNHRPSIGLRVFLTSLAPQGHRVTFEVIDRGKGLQVLAFLQASEIITDIARYTPGELTADVVEQVVVDALEHIFSCVSEMT